MGNNVVIIASWIIIGYTVLVILFGLVFAGVELSKEMSEKKAKQAEEQDKERKNNLSVSGELQGQIRYELNTFYAQMSCLLDKDAEGHKSIMNIPTDLPEQMRYELNTFYAQMSCLLDKGMGECSATDKAYREQIINEVIHRLDQELKYGSIDEALSDTLETCVVRLKSLLPGEVQ